MNEVLVEELCRKQILDQKEGMAATEGNKAMKTSTR
jgi:hypothetical protein